jgi:P4 family phage/plasmid primase-like protien
VSDSPLAAFEEYTERGWFVHPIHRCGDTRLDEETGELVAIDKRPILPGWQRASTNDPADVRRWLGERRFAGANIGVHAERSGLVIVDLDVRPDKNGIDSWLELSHGWEPDTFTVRTPTGGLHYYFEAPEGVRLANTAGKLGKGIDTRSSGYAVAPPSVTTAGEYMVTNWSVGRLEPAPRWLVAKILERRTEVARPFVPVVPGVSASASSVLARVKNFAAELADCGDGANDLAMRLAVRAGNYVGAGQIERAVAESVLIGAMEGWKFTGTNTRASMISTIREKVALGMKTPRAWEELRSLTGGVELPAPPPDEPEAPRSSRVVTGWSTDDGQAREMRRLFPGLRFAEAADGGKLNWFAWSGKHWSPVGESKPTGLMQNWYQRQLDELNAQIAVLDLELEAAKDRGAEPDEEKEGKLDALEARAKSVTRFMGASKQSNILKAWRVMARAAIDEFDAHPELLNTPDGVVDLRTGELSPHDPSLMLTKLTRGRYRPGYRHADWDSALESLPDGLRTYLHIRVGQAVTGEASASDDMVLLVGGGSNGKSAIMDDGLLHALGDFAMLASPNLFTKAEGGASPERASLRGARLVLAEELSEEGVFSTAEVKRIVGTSTISARKLYQGDMTFTASHTIFVNTNHLPQIRETTDGDWRRYCPIPFPFKFVDGDPANAYERRGDADLKPRLRNGRQGQHDAMVTWAVEGAMKYFADPGALGRSRRPVEVDAALGAWRMSADLLLSFLDERVVADRGAAIPRKDLFKEFSSWLDEGQHKRWSSSTFYQRFIKHPAYVEMAVAEGQTRDHSIISRPTPVGATWSSNGSPLPETVRVFRNIRFKPS